MNATELSNVVPSALFLLILSLIIFKWWPEQRVDHFRQQMFALRDELFDFAADGRVKFDDHAYVLLRDLMNGTIRYAHNLTPYRTIMSFLRWKCLSDKPSNAWSQAWEQALKQINDADTRSQLENFHSRGTMLVVSQLVLSPGLLIVVLPFVAIGAVFCQQWATLRDIYVSVRDTIPVTLLEEEAVNS